MIIKQLSVFLENKQGRICAAADLLAQNNVNIRALSLADTSDYGILRLIVNAPERGRDALSAAGFSAMLTEVLVIKIPHRAGSLQEILCLIAARDVNVEYMYGLSVDGADASVVMKTGDLAVAEATLAAAGIETMTEEELSGL